MYDLIVLGTGGAGYQVAMKCREAGWNVAVINEGLFGGTCSVRGCIPKKVLAGTAEIADINRRLGEVGIVTNQPTMSWQELIKFKRTFTDPVPPSTEKALKEAGVAVFAGSPKFSGNLQLEVNGQQLEAKKIHIAVGSKPAKLPIEGFNYLITSDDFLELDELPKRIVFVGGGYVSFEFAHVASRFGADVIILHSDNHPLPMFDTDIIQTLIEASRDVGIKLELNAGAQKIEKKGDNFTVTTAGGKTFEADLVVHGAGRPPAIDVLNLEATGVEYDKRRGVLVDDYFRSTSNPDVYAAGDAAAAGPPLSPVAGVQGGIVADNLLGKERKQPSYLSTPSVIFSTPAVAKVGYLEQEAKDKSIDCDVITTDLAPWFDSKRLGLKYAKSKVLVEKGTGKIVGAHLIGNHAEDLISIFSLAIELGLTTEQLKAPIFAFPTASDDMRYMF
ncbi:MAG TPA: NAD(P)/FAD-dependent oxidoreductase [Candidatus Dormibacteraeota bacterium]|nr:NAD(P)/FAD-dependent oxidoreductase [Candidatus Dormibacteraeota bacterium]